MVSNASTLKNIVLGFDRTVLNIFENSENKLII